MSFGKGSLYSCCRLNKAVLESKKANSLLVQEMKLFHLHQKEACFRELKLKEHFESRDFI